MFFCDIRLPSNISPKSKKSKKRKKLLIKHIIEIIESNNKRNSHIIFEQSIVCPYCKGNNYIKNGKNNDRQRYFCKTCGRSFMEATNSVIYHTHKSVDLWKEYVKCLVNQYSLRKCASVLKINLKTAFFWRHKILDALQEQLEVDEMSGKIQMNTIHMKCNFKGNHSKSSFTMPRKSYRRGPVSIEEYFSQDHVCIMGAMNHTGDVIMKPVCINDPGVEDMLDAFGYSIKQGSTLITDTRYNYKKFAEICNVEHVILKRFSAYNAAYNLRKITGFLKKYEYFLKPYRGVATKYTSGYISLYKYIEKKLYIKREYESNDNGRFRFVNKYKTTPLFKCSSHSYFNKRLKSRPVIFKRTAVLDVLAMG